MAAGLVGIKNFGGTKRNKAEQLKWRGFFALRAEIVEMAEGWRSKCVNGAGFVRLCGGAGMQEDFLERFFYLVQS